ncbi:MAG: M48 family metalloprotease [bacterium]
MKFLRTSFTEAWKYPARLFLLFVFLLSLPCCSIPPQVNGSRLDSASPSSVPPEVELGREIFEKLKPQLEFTESQLVQAYVDRMGKKILKQVRSNGFEFRYFVIRSDQLNAFALPNGYIFLTDRLLNAVRTEDELAFVLCHETAHVTRAHFRRLLSKKSKVDIATMAAMIAGILLARDSELQTAIQAFSIGANQTFFLKYSREFEDEADETGFRYLTRAGYQGGGAIQFMEKLHRLERITIVPPAYLSTHPPTSNRIYHLEQLHGRNYPSSPSLEPSRNFRRFQIWNRIETEHLQDYLQDLKRNYQDNPNNPDILYGLALTLDRTGKAEESMDFFKKGLAQDPNDTDVLRDLGYSLFRHGRYQEAVTNLSQAIKIDPADFLAFHYLGRALKEMNRLEEAIANLKQSRELYPDFPETYFMLGLVYQQKGRLKEAHQCFATHFSLKGNQKAAHFHLREADKFKANNQPP